MLPLLLPLFLYINQSTSDQCPFITRATNSNINISIDDLLQYNRTCGVSESSPSPNSKWMNIREFIDNDVYHNKSKLEVYLNPPKILWGPSDRNHYMEYQRCIPLEVSKSFGCKHRMPLSFGLGGKYAGLPFHHHIELYNQLLYGEKVWYLFPNGHPPPAGGTNLESIRRMISAGATPIVCVQKAGDVMHVPEGYWHATVNRKVSASVGCSSSS